MNKREQAIASSIAVVLILALSGCIFPRHQIVTFREIEVGEHIERDIYLPSNRGWPLRVDTKGSGSISDADRKTSENVVVAVEIQNLSDHILPVKTWAFLADGKDWDSGQARPEPRSSELKKGESVIVFRGPLSRLVQYGSGIVVGRPMRERNDDFHVRVVMSFEDSGSFAQPVHMSFFDGRFP